MMRPGAALGEENVIHATANSLVHGAQPPQARLSPAEIAAYHRDGQVTPAWRLSQAQLARLRSAVDRAIGAAKGQTDFIALPHLPPEDPAGQALAREFFEIATWPELLDLAEQLIGPDIAFWASSVFGKPAGAGREVPWHQDGRYWPIRPRATLSIWIAIDPSTPENGCMRILPGSHVGALMQHDARDDDDLVLNTFIADPRFDESRARDVVLEPGQISLHHIDLAHGSRPNRSTQRRAGYVIRYMPTTAVFDRTIPEYQGSKEVAVPWHTRPIWLVRGVDRSGANDFSIGHGAW